MHVSDDGLMRWETGLLMSAPDASQGVVVMETAIKYKQGNIIDSRTEWRTNRAQNFAPKAIDTLPGFLMPQFVS